MIETKVKKYKREKDKRISYPQEFLNSIGLKKGIRSKGNHLPDYVFKFDHLTIDKSGLKILKGYEHDGCSPKIAFRLFGKRFIIGTPDFHGWITFLGFEFYVGSTKEGSENHDIIYEQRHHLEITRYQADQLFLYDLREDGFLLAKLYYLAVRAFGWIWWYLL